MYNTNIVCTYNSSSIFLETDKISEKDKDFIKNVIYRQELLDILGIQEYNEEEIDKCMNYIYDIIKECKELKECMQTLSKNLMSSDDKIGLMILFSFDYLYLTHNCICDFLSSAKITDENLNKLKYAILYF